MKPSYPRFFKFISAALGLLLGLSAFDAGAYTGYVWDPQGTAAGSPYTNSLSGVWESNLWSTDSATQLGQSPTSPWLEGKAAEFAVHSGTGTPAFTVTMNSNHTVAGIFDGPLVPDPCPVTITGAGIMTLPSGLQGFDITSNTGDPGSVTINTVIAGTGTLTPEGGGQLFLNATNTYTGGTSFGFSGGQFNGLVNFNNAKSFGTGALVVSNTGTVTGALVCEVPTALTITNAWVATNASLNIVANAAGVTFSGPFKLTGTLGLGVGATNTNPPFLVIFSGVMSGAGGFNKFNLGTLRLSGANTYSNLTTVSNGTLQLGAAGGFPSGTGRGNMVVASPGVLDLNGFSGSINGLTGTGTITNSSSGTGTLNVGNNDQTSEFAGVIKNTVGTLNLTKVGAGTLTLDSANAYTGVTTVNGGALVTGISGAIPNTSSVTIAAGASLDVDNNHALIAGLNGLGSVVNNGTQIEVSNNFSTGNTLTTYSAFSGVITEGSLIKDGASSMSLRGSNINSAALITVQNGILSVGAGPNRLPVDSSVNVSTGAIFQLDANNQTIASLAGNGTVNLGGGQLAVSGSAAFPGLIQDSELPGASIAIGHGLRGYYYSNQDLSSLAAVRDDANINFSDFTSPAPQLPATLYPKTNNISVRWLGQVQSTAAGTYSFQTTSDDGTRLWVNGVLLIDDWVTQSATTKSNTIVLAANTRYDIVMEYFNQTGPATAKLSWIPPGDAVASVIPTDYLYLPSPGMLVNTGFLTLNGTAPNTYAGGTLVSSGTLTTESSGTGGALGNGNVTVADGATLQLFNTDLGSNGDLLLATGSPSVDIEYINATNVVHALSLDSGLTFQPKGTYGSSSSAAAHQPSQITGSGNGIILVTASPSANALTTSGATSVYGNSVTFTSTITGTGPTPTGTVTFFDGASAIGTSALNGSGVATLAVSDLQVVTSPHSITAVYNGDANYATSTSAAVSQTVTPLVLTVSAGTVTISNKVYDSTSNASIAILPISGVLTNDSNYVHFSGTATFSDKNVGVGKTVTITGLTTAGSLAGNYALSTSSTTSTGTITNKALTVTGITASSKPFDGTTAATINTSAAVLVGVFAGDVVTTNLAGAIGTFSSATVANTKTVTITGITVGGTDGGNYIVTSPTTTANITKGVSSSVIVSSLNPSSTNANVTFTVTVSGPGGTPTGNVTFQTNAVTLGTVALVGGVAATNTSLLPLGTNTITAVYAGDTTYLGITSSISQVVNNVTPSPKLSITNIGPSVVLTWSGTFTLQTSPSPLTNSAWSDVVGATSPFTNAITGIGQYYRLKQ